jgi:CDP-glycerol glycerophosphotransferase (TagB/SpsB family)
VHINFVIQATGKFYLKTLNVMNQPIYENLKRYTCSNICEDNAVNVHYFHEKLYCNKVRFFQSNGKPRGINVFISHGLADKNWRDYKKVKHFNYICVSGKQWQDKMVDQGARIQNVLITGYTKLDPIFQGKFKQRPNKKIRVLYAPTHNLAGWSMRGDASSYPRFLPYLDKLSQEFEVVSSFHPANNGGQSTLQGLVNANVVISDCSSMIYEAWVLGKPVIFPDWLVKNYVQKTYKNSFESYVYEKYLGYHARTFKELKLFVREAAKKGNDIRVKNFIDSIFGISLRGHSGEVTARALLRICGGD